MYYIKHNIFLQVNENVSIDIVDPVSPLASAPRAEDLDKSVQETEVNMSKMQLTESAPSAPVLEVIPRTISG